LVGTLGVVSFVVSVSFVVDPADLWGEGDREGGCDLDFEEGSLEDQGNE